MDKEKVPVQGRELYRTIIEEQVELLGEWNKKYIEVPRPSHIQQVRKNIEVMCAALEVLMERGCYFKS